MTCRRRFGYNVLEKGADAMDARILVVDDEPEIADLVEVYLKSEGCTVFKCGTGTEALAVVRNQALDLALSLIHI